MFMIFEIKMWSYKSWISANVVKGAERLSETDNWKNVDWQRRGGVKYFFFASAGTNISDWGEGMEAICPIWPIDANLGIQLIVFLPISREQSFVNTYNLYHAFRKKVNREIKTKYIILKSQVKIIYYQSSLKAI